MIDGLGADVATLRTAKAEAPAVHLDKEAATLTQDEAIESGAEFVAAVRTAASRSRKSDAPFRKSLGVGSKVQSTVSSVEAALKSILKTAEEKPEEVRAIGVLQDELEEAVMLLASVGKADSTQEGLKVTAKVSTGDRNAAQLRVEAAVDEIVAKAALAFRKKKDIAKLFADLIPSAGKGKAAPASPPAAPSKP